MTIPKDYIFKVGDKIIADESINTSTYMPEFQSDAELGLVITKVHNDNSERLDVVRASDGKTSRFSKEPWCPFIKQIKEYCSLIESAQEPLTPKTRFELLDI